MKIEYNSIGIVHSPFKELAIIPNQPSKAKGVKQIVENRLMISDLDVLDGTPVIDIKPYFREFESNEHIKTGWHHK